MLIQAVMEAEVATKAGASFGERSSERITYRNSYWGRPWDTRVGALELEVPEGAGGPLLPFYARTPPAQRTGPARRPAAGLCEGCLHPPVEDLVQALGCEGISKSQVSRICQQLGTLVDSLLGRPLDGGPCPCGWMVRRVTRHRMPDSVGRNFEEIPGSTDPPRSESRGENSM